MKFGRNLERKFERMRAAHSFNPTRLLAPSCRISPERKTGLPCLDVIRHLSPTGQSLSYTSRLCPWALVSRHWEPGPVGTSPVAVG